MPKSGKAKSQNSIKGLLDVNAVNTRLNNSTANPPATNSAVAAIHEIGEYSERGSAGVVFKRGVVSAMDHRRAGRG